MTLPAPVPSPSGAPHGPAARPLRCLLCADADALPDAAGGADLLIRGIPRDPAALAALRAGPGAPRLYLRLDPRAPDLAGLALAPDGVLLTGIGGGLDIGRLASRLAVGEAEMGLPDGATRILAGLGSARALLGAADLAGASPRLAGLVWDAEALARDFAPAPLPAPVARHARATVVLAAAAARLPALAPPCPDPARAGAAAQAARRAGFAGMMARDAGEATAIAAVFGGAPERGAGRRR